MGETSQPTIYAMGTMGAFNHNKNEYIEIPSIVEKAKLLELSIDAV